MIHGCKSTRTNFPLIHRTTLLNSQLLQMVIGLWISNLHHAIINLFDNSHKIMIPRVEWELPLILQLYVCAAESVRPLHCVGEI